VAPPPEVVFDVMESPLRDLGGDVIYTEDENGRLAPGRRFSPGFWRDRFQARRILEQTQGVVGEPEDRTQTEGSATAPRVPPRARRQWRDELTQAAAVFRRAFIAKLRHRGNLAATLLEAPLLALLISFVLRYSEDGVYTFASAFHIPTYLFMTLVVGMFLGLTNSADDIVRDQVLLQRERNHDVRAVYYVLAKTGALAVFAAAQCAVYLLIGNAVLEIRDMFWDYFLWMLLSALTGVVLGLLISSLVRNSKTAINIIPLILIPQIILGGALIKYEEMNRNLDLAHNLRRWLRGDDGRPLDPPNKLEVPFLCEFMPLRWSYEAIVIAQATRNPLAVAQDSLQRRIDTIVKQLPPPPAKDPPELSRQLNDAKQALALVSGLEGRSPEHVERRLQAIMTAIDGPSFDPESDEFSGKAGPKPVSAGELYSNQKVWDLFNKAEVERLHDGHRQPPNVFFGLKKYLGLKAPEEVTAWPATRALFEWGREVATLRLNFAVLILFCFGCLLALYYSLRRRLTSV
jgi:ABC-type multidrug transport system permease subunit